MRVNSFAFFFLISAVAINLRAQPVWTDELLLVPEKTNFIKTSGYPDVIDFLQAISQKSNDVRTITMGKSAEGRDIPVAILASPMVQSAEEAKHSEKLIVYVQGNIHAGEVEGKEVIMMLMRDILLGEKKHLLDSLIILFAPIYNTDSNEKMAQGRRPSQEDSPLEVGIRENSQGLDLNRDGVKMEAPETQSLMSNIIVPWDPQLFVDLHTTNGTWHGYSLTWAPSYHSSGEYEPYRYTNNVMLPAIAERLQAEKGLLTGPFGDFSIREGWPIRNFYTYNHHPRYLVNQFGLRNRMAILSESFAHERFYQRIYSTYSFVDAILDHAYHNASEIKTINQEADRAVVAKASSSSFREKKGVRFKMVVSDTINGFRAYQYLPIINQEGKKEYVRAGNIVLLDSVNYLGGFTPTVTSSVPHGYVIPKAFKVIADHLTAMGITVTQVEKSRTFRGEKFSTEMLEPSQRKFEGHLMVTAKGVFKPTSYRAAKGDYIVDLSQPLANLAFYLLEPQSDDGLVTWNFFDSYFKEEGITSRAVDYPVFKYFN